MQAGTSNFAFGPGLIHNQDAELHLDTAGIVPRTTNIDSAARIDNSKEAQTPYYRNDSSRNMTWKSRDVARWSVKGNTGCYFVM